MSKKSNTSYTATLDCIEEVLGNKNIIVEVKDAQNYIPNIARKTITISNLDSKPPTITSSNQVTEDWAKQKTLTFSCIDEGSGNVQIAFNNVNEYGETTKSGNTYQRTYDLAGDVYGEIMGAIYYKDAVGNVNTEFIKVKNLDNTAPTIENVTRNEKTLTITANDINKELNLSGSGVEKYAITKTSAQPKDVQWQDSNELEVSGNGIYYVWAKDKVGNISSPYQVKVILQ